MKKRYNWDWNILRNLGLSKSWNGGTWNNRTSIVVYQGLTGIRVEISWNRDWNASRNGGTGIGVY